MIKKGKLFLLRSGTTNVPLSFAGTSFSPLSGHTRFTTFTDSCCWCLLYLWLSRFAWPSSARTSFWMPKTIDGNGLKNTIQIIGTQSRFKTSCKINLLPCLQAMDEFLGRGFNLELRLRLLVLLLLLQDKVSFSYYLRTPMCRIINKVAYLTNFFPFISECTASSKPHSISVTWHCSVWLWA